MQVERIKIREADARDLNFILATWLRSFKSSSPFTKRIKNKIYYQFHHELIRKLLQTAKVLVAADGVDDSVIYGWLVVDELERNDAIVGKWAIVHYTYVKSAFRGLGIAHDLWKAAALHPDITLFTHWTYECEKLLEKWPTLTYCPYLT